MLYAVNGYIECEYAINAIRNAELRYQEAIDGPACRGVRQCRMVKHSVVHGVVAFDQYLLAVFAERSLCGFLAVRNITHATISLARLIRGPRFIIRLDRGRVELGIGLDS